MEIEEQEYQEDDNLETEDIQRRVKDATTQVLTALNKAARYPHEMIECLENYPEELEEIWSDYFYDLLVGENN